MKIDVQKIDERIKKLQDLRKLATDPEIASLLSEFITDGEQRTQPSQHLEPSQHFETQVPANTEPIQMPGSEATNDLIKEVVNGVDAPSNGGLWSRRRG
jgi:hypothetical protein